MVGLFLILFGVVDLETSNSLMPAVGEPLMLSLLLIVPGIEHAFVLARAEAQRVYAAGKESNNK